MSCFSNRVEHQTENPQSNQAYFEKRTCARVTLAVKKVLFALVSLINLGALGTVFTFIILYCPIPTSPILTSTFAVGFLGALAGLRIPTLGISAGNFHSHLNPSYLLGKGLAYLFFGPMIFVYKKVDWTNYGDKKVANQVTAELKELPFEEIYSKYGPHFSNLKRYGFISEDHRKKIDALREEFKPLRAKELYLKPYLGKLEKAQDSSNKLLAEKAKNDGAKEAVEKKWEALRKEIQKDLPTPEIDLPNFESRRIRHCLRFGRFAYKTVTD